MSAEELEMPQDEDSYVARGHQFSDIAVQSGATAYLGETHIHQHPRAAERLITSTKAYGLCLGQAPQMDTALFVGREADVEKIQEALQPSEPSTKLRRVVLGGMGGIGKTQLAIAYAVEYGKSYDSVFWLNATSESTLKASYRELASLVFSDKDLADCADEYVIAAVRQWLSRSDNKRWLLIYDNYDEPGAFSIKEYYPLASHGSFIITSRVPNEIVGQRISVGTLAEEESLKILESRAERGDLTSDAYARKIAQRLAGLPIALATAGAYLRDTTTTFKQYFEDYEERFDIDQGTLQLPEYENRRFATTWNITYQHLCLREPLTADLLKLLAYFDNQYISFAMLRGGKTDHLSDQLRQLVSDATAFTNAVSVLVRLSLVEKQATNDSYTMHNCVHDWTLAELNSNVADQYLGFAFSCAISHTSEIEDMRFWKHPDLAAHVVRLTLAPFLASNPLIPMTVSDVRRLYFLAGVLYSNRHLSQATVMTSYVERVSRSVLGDHKVSTYTAKLLRGHACMGQEKYTEARGILEPMLDEAPLFADSIDPAADLQSFHLVRIEIYRLLGSIYLALGDHEEAADRYIRGINYGEQCLGDDNIEVIDARRYLSLLLLDVGDLAGAELVLVSAIERLESIVDSSHWMMQHALHSLCDVYLVQKRFTHALDLFRQLRTQFEDYWGPTNPWMLRFEDRVNRAAQEHERLSQAETPNSKAANHEDHDMDFAANPQQKHTSSRNTRNSTKQANSEGRRVVKSRRVLRSMSQKVSTGSKKRQA